MTPAKAKLTLFSVMLISVLGTAGIALPYPVLAPYFIDYPANDLTHFMGFHPKVLLGFSLAIYPLGLLIGSIFVGALSDHYGRRKVLLLTLSGSAIGYFLTALSVVHESFIGFTLARLVTGICEGNISIARAIGAELHPHIERTKAISLVYAATYVGWLVGPLIGGFLMVYGVANVFNIAAVGILIALAMVFFTIERRQQRPKPEYRFWRLIKENNSLTVLKHKEVLPVFWFYFLYSMGLNAFYDFYPVWFVDKLSFDSRGIAWATVALTACMVVVSSFWVDKINHKFGEVASMIGGGIALALLIAIQPFSTAAMIYPLFFVIGGWIAITNGMVPTYLSKYFGHLGQGKVMGLQTSIFCITNVIIAVVGGPLSVISSTLVILIGAVLIAASVLVMFITRQQQASMISKVLAQQGH
ncbi:MFS transporter [Kangiella sp. TOML190]|uniref:MFS transporter n=1 Tax=Kangiella sp. TOML190 TaxID=2931351 RepID=UPI00203E6E1D|nr:MFS transporter [Kangiella sp. TOML190]